MYVHRDNPLLGPLSRADFITANLPLVKSVVKRHRAACNATRTPYEDAFQDGVIGLLNAYDRYADPSVDFAVFAFPHISGQIRNSLTRRPSTGVRVPHYLVSAANRVEREYLTEETAETVAELLGITVRRAEMALRCARSRQTSALPERDNNGRLDDHTALYTDAFLARLKPKPRAIIERLMALDTPSEVAQDFGMTRQAVYIVTKRVRENYEQYAKISA